MKRVYPAICQRLKMKPAFWKKGGFKMIDEKCTVFRKIAQDNVFVAVVGNEQRQWRQQKSGNEQTPGDKHQYKRKTRV